MGKVKPVNSLLQLPLRLTYDKANQRVTVSGCDGYERLEALADKPQIVDSALRVCQPLTAKKVMVAFKLKKNDSEEILTTIEYPVTIPGLYAGGNTPKPSVVPELSEWHGIEGCFACGQAAEIVIEPALKEELAFSAKEFYKDYEDITGRPIGIREGSDPKKGDFYFTLDKGNSFLGKEGYQIIIEDTVKVTAAHPTGAYWATRTILQILKQDNGKNALPKGEIRDYPKFPLRGFMLDVGRRPVSLKMLYQIIRNMAWYKMNDLQLHLNDNYIWLEDYAKNATEEATFQAYDAFRLESGLKNSKGETPTAKDYSYSKKEFSELIKWARQYGVHIVPEIDVPAHAMSFTRFAPEYMVKSEQGTMSSARPLTDHLDVRRDEVIDFVKEIFDDYTRGEPPVFDADTVVHIGADEFESDPGAYRRFFNKIVPHIAETNTVRIWGSLTKIKDNPATSIQPEAIKHTQMDLWSNGWADGAEMYQMGFRLINIIDQYTYMVPNGTRRRGSYTDLLNKKALYKNFEPQKVRLVSGKYAALPAGDPQMLGAAYAIWFDNIDKRASGVTEIDLFERFFDALPLMAEKTWATGKEKGKLAAIEKAAEKTGFAPSSNPLSKAASKNSQIAVYPLGAEGKKDLSGNCYDILAFENAEINEAGKAGLTLRGGKSFAALPLGQLGPNHSLKFSLTLYSKEPGEILFEADAPYGTHDIRITANGNLGFTRENYEYEFHYSPELNKPVNLEIRCSPLCTMLIVNGGEGHVATGKFLHNGQVKKDGVKNASFPLPLQRIGSASNAAHVVIADVKITVLSKPVKKKFRLFQKR